MSNWKRVAKTKTFKVGPPKTEVRFYFGEVANKNFIEEEVYEFVLGLDPLATHSEKRHWVVRSNYKYVSDHKTKKEAMKALEAHLKGDSNE